jgi:citrate lyase beta subunit
LIERLQPDGMVVPKASLSSVRVASRLGVPILALIEDGAGLRRAFDLAKVSGVARLGLGSVDLSRDLRLGARPDGQELAFARGQLVRDSAAAGLPRPVDGVEIDVRNSTALRKSARLASTMGFGAKLCLHPAQVEIVETVFGPDSTELAWARRVVAANGARANPGEAFSLDGQMIDQAVVHRANLLLAEASE